MKKTEVSPAPRAKSSLAATSKWEREQRAFMQLRPSLLKTLEGKYVAIHGGKLVDSGKDKITLGMRVYSKFGYVPIYVGLVTSGPQTPVRLASPHVCPRRNG